MLVIFTASMGLTFPVLLRIPVRFYLDAVIGRYQQTGFASCSEMLTSRKVVIRDH